MSSTTVSPVVEHSVTPTKMSEEEGKVCSEDKSCSGGEEEYSEEEEYESECEDSEDEEPKLKYERVRGHLVTLLERESLTSIASNDKVSSRA